MTRRRPPVRTDAAEVLRWWGVARGLTDARRPSPALAAVPDAGFNPLDAALGMQMLRPAEDESDSLSAAVPSHAITLQGSALFQHRRPPARARGGRGRARRRHSRHGDARHLRAARRGHRGLAWLCDLTVVAVEGVTPRGPGLLLRRRTSGGGAPVALPDGYSPLTLESAELDELYDVRIADGCDEAAAREALTPAMIAWLCERSAEALVVETGGASVRSRRPRCSPRTRSWTRSPLTPAGSRMRSSTTRHARCAPPEGG